MTWDMTECYASHVDKKLAKLGAAKPLLDEIREMLNFPEAQAKYTKLKAMKTPREARTVRKKLIAEFEILRAFVRKRMADRTALDDNMRSYLVVKRDAMHDLLDKFSR